MKHILSAIVGLFACLQCIAQNNLNSEFYDGISKVEANYRVAKAELIKKADRVVVYLVDFDGFTAERSFPNESESISVAPYKMRTKILGTTEVKGDDRKKLLDILSKCIAEPEHTGGAECHYPIHGIRIYAGDTLLHEGTFCWVCHNFAFSYPQGSTWLDTNADLKDIFTRLVPIPQAELERFNKKYGEQDGTEQPATRPESDSEGGDKPQPELEGRSR